MQHTVGESAMSPAAIHPEAVWDRCLICGLPVQLLGTDWHHTLPSNHPALSRGQSLGTWPA